MKEEQLEIPEVQDGNAILTAITALCEKAHGLKDAIAEAEAKVATDKGALKEILEVHLPRLMESIGMEKIRTRKGTDVEIRTEVYASVPKARMDAAMAWLKANNMAKIAKVRYEISESEVQAAKDAGFTLSEEASIHASTLRAFVKERLEVDENFPRDIFGVSEAQVASIK